MIRPDRPHSPCALAIGTSTKWCSVALAWRSSDATADGEQAIAAGNAAGIGAQRIESLDALVDNGHAEHALPMIGRLLASCGRALTDIDAVAFDAGPGAFTGLRIGCGIAQGLGFALGVPLLPVVSLDAIACAGGHDGFVGVIVDARMGEVYWAAYRAGARIGAPRVGTPTEASEALLAALLESDVAGHGAPPLALGDGLARHPAVAEALRGHGFGARADVIPAAHAIARLALRRLAAGERGLDPGDAAPVYVRDKVALDSREQHALRVAREAAASPGARAAPSDAMP